MAGTTSISTSHLGAAAHSLLLLLLLSCITVLPAPFVYLMNERWRWWRYFLYHGFIFLFALFIFLYPSSAVCFCYTWQSQLAKRVCRGATCRWRDMLCMYTTSLISIFIFNLELGPSDSPSPPHFLQRLARPDCTLFYTRPKPTSTTGCQMTLGLAHKTCMQPI